MRGNGHTLFYSKICLKSIAQITHDGSWFKMPTKSFSSERTYCHPPVTRSDSELVLTREKSVKKPYYVFSRPENYTLALMPFTFVWDYRTFVPIHTKVYICVPDFLHCMASQPSVFIIFVKIVCRFRRNRRCRKHFRGITLYFFCVEMFSFSGKPILGSVLKFRKLDTILKGRRIGGNILSNFQFLRIINTSFVFTLREVFFRDFLFRNLYWR